MQRDDPKETESSEELSEGLQPNDPSVDPPSHAYKIAKWTNMTKEGSKLSKVRLDPSSGKPISRGYKTVKWTEVCREGSQPNAAPGMSRGDYKLAKWTDMSRPQEECKAPVNPHLPSRDYNVVKWTTSSEGSQLIKAPVDLGNKVVQWTNMSSQELGETPVDAGLMSRDYKIVRWVDVSGKDGSKMNKAPPVYPSCDNRTVQKATSEGLLQPSAEELVDAEEESSDGYRTYFQL